MLETPTLPSSAGHKSPRSIYMKILTWIRGFRVKIANCSPLDCLAIPRRKSSTKKTKPNIEKWPESLGVMLEFQYRTWAIAIEYFALPRWGTSQFCLLLCSLVPPVLLTLFCVCSGGFHWGCGQQCASLLQLFFKECFGRKAFCWGLRFHACLMVFDNFAWKWQTLILNCNIFFTISFVCFFQNPSPDGSDLPTIIRLVYRGAAEG